VLWQRSWLYRLWVVGGLIAVVAVVLRVGLTTQPGDDPPYIVFGAAIGVYLLGIIVMQAFGLASGRPGAEDTAPTDTTAGLPETTEGLRQLLTLPGADGRRARAGAERAHRQSVGLFIPTALIAILLPLGGYLYISGAVTGVWQPLGETGPGIPVAALPGLAMVVVMALMLPRNMRRARQATDDYNSGLGLAITATPQSILLPRVGTGGVGHHIVGPTTMEGIRHGHAVTVDMNSGSTAVLVAVPTQPFTAAAGDDRIEPGDPAPQWAIDALRRVPQDRRWRRVQVDAGPAGIRVDRRGSALDGEWMLDLWLAETLASASEAHQAR
jgi:hypothetical protein